MSYLNHSFKLIENQKKKLAIAYNNKKAVNNYTYKQNDKNTGSLLNLKNFKDLYGMLLLI